MWVLYPVFALLLLSAVGGTYETYRESRPTRYPMAGRLVDVGDHRLHIDCTGTGSPTVVLEPGLGEASTEMGWIAPAVARTTRVCVYDRAGRGWSQAADGPHDGVQVATDLHTLLERAGERGPYVLAGHSAGGLYVQNFAHLYPNRSPESSCSTRCTRAGHDDRRLTRVLLDVPPGFRSAAVAVPPRCRSPDVQSAYDGLPAQARNEERAFIATPRHSRSIRDEFSEIRTAMRQARSLTRSATSRSSFSPPARTPSPDGRPCRTSSPRSRPTASTDCSRTRTHSMLIEDRSTAAQSSRAIRDVVHAVRNRTALTEKAA